MSDVAKFLKSSRLFEHATDEQIEAIAPLFTRERHDAGNVVLHQGGHSDALYFVYSGRMAARLQKDGMRETVAHLQPPDSFAEVPFITGRPSLVDIIAELDSELLRLPREALAKVPAGDYLLRSVMRVVTGRVQSALAPGPKPAVLPVVLLLNHPNWEAPRAFAAEFARSLGRQTGRRTLLVRLTSERQTDEVRHLDDVLSAGGLTVRPGDADLHSDVAGRLAAWKREFGNIILNAAGSRAPALRDAVCDLANWHGELVGPGDRLPEEDEPTRFIVQSSVQPTLPYLDGSRQIIFDAALAEAAHASNAPLPEPFRRTVDSIARCVAQMQVGLALGGGAAWGWAHIGVLSVLEEAGLPIDMISGSSMGSVIGALRCAGYSAKQMLEIATYWGARTRRFIEWRFWRMSLINEKRLCKTLRQYFGDHVVNQTEIPFWANAADIQTGQECTLRSGSLVDCVRASVALPGFLAPVARNANLLVDAGIMDPVPVRLLRRMGCHFAVGVNAMAELKSQRISKHYPLNAIDIMSRCMVVVGREIGQARAEQAADVVFTPALGDITMLQFSRSAEIIERGRKTASEHLPAVLASYERLKQRASE